MRPRPALAAQSQLNDKIRLTSLSSDPSMSVATIEQHHFRRVCSKYATGVTILTVLDAHGAPHGMTANSFTSVSLTPPLILVCIDKRSSMLDHFETGTEFAINVLDESQKDLSNCFARSGHNRFEGVVWTPGVTGAPLFPGMLASLECVVTRMVDAGDHVVTIGEALHATWRDEGQPLIYFNSGYQALRAESA